MRRNQKYAKVEIGGVDYSKYLAFPFVFQDTGTEQLDSAIITLNNLPTEARFAPFAPVSLCGGKYTYVIADDSVKAVYGRGLWRHEITLIDETKATERILMEAKSFTQPLVQDFGEPKSASAFFVAGGSISAVKTLQDYKTPINTNLGDSATIISARNAIGAFGNETSTPIDQLQLTSVQVLYSKTEVALTDGNYKEIFISNSMGIDDTAQFVISQSGIYTIKYHFVFPGPANGTVAIPISFYIESEMPKKYSVYDVLQITLETAEPLFKGGAPRYGLSLTEEQEARYRAMDAPEIHFENGRSLYENLKTIGDYVHALPKVKNGSVIFQDLGSAERADLSKGKLFGESADFNAAEYATTIEANFANLINASDEAEGSVTDPYTDGYISLRSNNYRIKEEDSYIPTAFPIGTKIKKVIVREHADDAANTVLNEIDITPAVFEKNEYDILSSFSGVYPFSKTHALYYVTGQKNIEGLWYRAQDGALSETNAFKRYALTNVLNFFSGQDKSEYDYTLLSFQVTYIPFINGRARQERTEDVNGTRIVLAHNQSANQLSAKAFGENLRGKVAMLGNATEAKQYIFTSLDDIPKGGTLYDRKKFISLVTTRVYPDYCLSQIDLSENYNNAGAFVQMKTGIRQYEIPTGKDRCTLLEEFCVIGKSEETADSAADALYMLCKPLMREKTVKAFGVQGTSDITAAKVKTYDEDLKEISHDITLPVYSTSLGNSVYFGFSFEDNFAAGKRSSNIGLSAARGTEYVEYGTPFYSRAKYLDFAFVDRYTAEDGYAAMAFPNDLPIANGLEADNEYIANDTAGLLVWNKDAADIGNVAYQLHFCSNDGYIITGELARMMPYVRSSTTTEEAAVVFFYDREIDELTGNVSPDAIVVGESSITINPDDCFIEIDALPTQSYKSFVIKRRSQNVCIIGKNTENADKQIYFNFKRKR